MVAIAVLSALAAVAIPGYQAWLIVFGGVLIAWATFGLPERTSGRRVADAGYFPRSDARSVVSSFVKHAGHFGAVVSRARQIAGEGGRQL